MPVLISRDDYNNMIQIFRWVQTAAPVPLAETARTLADLLEAQLKQQ